MPRCPLGLPQPRRISQFHRHLPLNIAANRRVEDQRRGQRIVKGDLGTLFKPDIGKVEHWL